MSRARVKPPAGNGRIEAGDNGLNVQLNKSSKGMVGAMIDLEAGGNLSTMISVLARFTFQGDVKLSPAKATQVYREFSIEDLDKLMASFKLITMALRNEAAPPPNSGG